MKSLTVKTKMLLLAMLAAGSLILLAGLNYWSLNYQTELEETKTLVDLTTIEMLTLRKHEKDFLGRNDEKYVAEFSTTFQAMRGNLDHLKKNLQTQSMETASLDEAVRLLEAYQQVFMALEEQMKKVGLNDEQGLRNEFRKVAHEAEALLEGQKSKELLLDALTLRRREKDFLLRMDWKYVQAMQTDYASMQENINKNVNLDAATKQQLRSLFATYYESFEKLAAAFKEMGLSDNEGMKGVLRANIHQTEAKLEEAEQQIALAVAAKIQRMTQAILVATGVLVVAITTWILLLARGIITMVMGLLAELNQATSQVTAASTQISSGAQDLSQGSTEQAASLEEISSTMEQISSQAKGNADSADRTAVAAKEMASLVEQSAHNAKDAASLSIEAKESAESGVAAMRQITTSMNEITNTSNKITDIIQVINDITHQTKMLATNAAIEAARAGEQGKGFAVVADEVSKLAEHSKISAKEIAGLIKESVEKSKQGAEFVVTGSKVLQEIYDNAIRLSSLIDGITNFVGQQAHAMEEVEAQVDNIKTASKEQASGLGQVNEAIVQLDQVTQASAANAEQSAAAAEELNSQAESLKELVLRISHLFGLEIHPAAEGGAFAAKSTAAAAAAAKPLLTYAGEAAPFTPKRATPKEGTHVKANKSIPLRDEFKGF